MNYLTFPTSKLPPVEVSPDPDVINMGQILASFYRRRSLILGAVALAAGLGLLMIALTPRVYSSGALLMLQPQQQRLTEGGAESQAAPDLAAVESQVEFLRSRTLAARLVDKLALVDRRRALMQTSPISGTMGWVRDVLGGLSSPASRSARREGMIDVIMANTSVKRRPSTYAVDVTVTARSPADAALFANTLADLYLRWQLEMRFDAASRTNAWLVERLNTLQQEVDQKERKVDAFRASTGLLSADGASTLTEQQMRDTQGAVLAAGADLMEKRARQAQVESLVATGGSVETIGAVLSSTTISELRTRQADAARRESEMATRYGPMHPDIIKVRAERANIDGQIKAEVARIEANVRNEVAVAQARLRSLQGALAGIRSQAINDNASMIRQRELERDAALTRSVYEGYLKRFQELGDQASLSGLSAQIVARAVEPRGASGRSAAWIFGLWLTIGLLAGLALAFAAELIDDRLDTVDAVERSAGISTVSSVPLLTRGAMKSLGPAERHPAGYVLRNPMSAFAEGYRVLRTIIRSSVRDIKVVAITSALPGEGKTMTALCLARISAMTGQQVLLVDCDMCLRGLSEAIAPDADAGVGEVLSGQAHWRDVLRKDGGSTVDLVPASARSILRDLFDSDTMDAFLAEARAEYDLVLLDCPPVLALADASQIARRADATIVVVGAKRTSTRVLRNAIRHLELAGTTVFGTVLNMVDIKAPGRRSYGDAIYYTDAQGRYFSTERA